MTGGAWIASYALLWVAVLVLALAVVVLLRQIGMLHARMRPVGVHPAGEGLKPGAPAPHVPGADFGAHTLTLVAFTSPSCALCDALLPSLHALERDYDGVALAVASYADDTAGVFRAYQVASTPYLVAVDRDGRVRGGGVANTLEQAEVLVAGALGTRREHDGAT